MHELEKSRERPQRAGALKGLEHLSYKDRGCSACRREDLIADFQYLKGAYRKAREGHFVRKCSDRIRGNGFKLKKGWI